MRHPDVLVLVPTLGERPEMLAACLRSLSRQTVPARIVVIAGANLDVVSPIAGDHGAAVLQQSSRGLAAALNEGWESDGWRSEFTGWLGDDDILKPHAVEVTAQKLARRRSASMVHGRCEVLDETGAVRFVIRNGWLASLAAGYGMNLIAQPGCLFRTSFVQLVGGVDASLRYAMDIDLYLKLRRVGRIKAVPQVIAGFRTHPTSLSTAYAEAAAAEANEVKRRHWRRAGRGAEILDMVARKATVATFEITKRISG